MLRKALVLGLAVVGVALGVVGFTWLRAAGANADPVKAPEKLLACGACHSMENEVLTWQANAHKNIACLECHTEGDPGWIRHEFVDKDDDMAAAAKAHPLKLAVAEKRCEECHQPQMADLLKDITPKPLNAATMALGVGKAMDVKAVHAKHIQGDAKLQCTACHTGDAHGNTVGSTPWRDAAHKVCLDCHAEKNVKIAVTGSTSCSACHVDAKAVAPADHKAQAVWQKAHGSSAGNNTCGQCHLGDSAGPHTQISNPTAFPSATKDACASCHNGVPMPHPDGFLSTHGKVWQATKAVTCETCHAPSAVSGSPAAGGAQSCNSCHAQSMPHPAGYLAQHGQAAKAAPATCTTCHSPANPANPGAAYAQPGYCINCHLTPMPHPANFLAQHGQNAKAKPATCEACHSPKNVARPTAAHANTAYCATCHDSYQHPTGWVGAHGTAVTDSCATCHTLQGQPGQHNACSTCHNADGTWHPNLWYVSHANVVNAKGDTSCKVCHDEVEPSCSQCHRDR